MSVIDLTAERNRRAQPHPDCRTTDDQGKTLYTFLTEWSAPDGRTYGGEVMAYDEAGAVEHIENMRRSLRVVGRLHESVPL